MCGERERGGDRSVGSSKEIIYLEVKTFKVTIKVMVKIENGKVDERAWTVENNMQCSDSLTSAL